MNPPAPPPPLGPLSRPKSLPETIYESVHRKIAEGAIDPARRLTETELARLLGVSRTPVRIALERLRREGLIDASPRRQAVDALLRQDIAEIMELRELVEPYLAARAAERATPGGVQALEVALQEEEKAYPLKSPQKFSMANHRFRQELMRLAGNVRLAESASRYDAQIQVLRRATLEQPRHREVVLAHHRRLVDCVRRGDGEQAESTMRSLMREAGRAMLALSADGGRDAR